MLQRNMQSVTSGQAGGLENLGPLKAAGALSRYILSIVDRTLHTSPRQVLSRGPVFDFYVNPERQLDSGSKTPPE